MRWVNLEPIRQNEVSQKEEDKNSCVCVCVCVYIYMCIYIYIHVYTGDTRDEGLIPGSGRSPGVGDGNPLHYSCLENPMDRGAR